jgi:hypothetical protein
LIQKLHLHQERLAAAAKPGAQPARSQVPHSTPQERAS